MSVFRRNESDGRLLVSKATSNSSTLLVYLLILLYKFGILNWGSFLDAIRKGLAGRKDVPDTTNMVTPPPFTPKIPNGQIPLSVVGVNYHARHLLLNVDETRMFQVWAPHQVNKRSKGIRKYLQEELAPLGVSLPLFKYNSCLPHKIFLCVYDQCSES